MLQRFVRIFGGDPNKRAIEEYAGVVEAVNDLEARFESVSSEALRAKTDEFRRRLIEGESLEDLLPEAFAVVREASKRTIGLRHYDVQLIGGAVLHEGKIAEMRTGEGKTLVATLPLYLNALALNPDWLALAREQWGESHDSWRFEPIRSVPVGRGTHLVTVNDYLARRDARWMDPIYNLLGLRVGVLQMAARTESGKRAFLVDLESESPHEDQHQLVMVPRREAYLADVTYGTNSEFGFDYLRDNMTMRLEDRVQRSHHYAIIDEVDNVLIDEARTPLIISGPSHDDTEWYVRMSQVVRQLRPEDFETNEKDRTVNLTEIGETHVEELLGMPLRDPERPEDITMEQARILGYLEQALRAQHLFHRNKEYLVQAGKVVIVDEFTGRLMPGRRWSDGLHQAVEAKEGVKVQSENVTYATITIQNYFRMYEKLSGMTGTAVTESEEFHDIYKLDVLAIPTNLEYQAVQPDSGLTTREDRDEEGYKYTFYARQDDPLVGPLYWKRQDYPDVVFRTQEAKLRAITREILHFHVRGRPILVGTTSVESSERLSGRLHAMMVQRLAQALLLRYAWLEANDRIEDGRQIPELDPLNQPLDSLNTAELRRMARDLALNLNLGSADNLQRLASIFNLEEQDFERLSGVLQGGIPHQVLNARKHTEESQIIAGAGEFGAVTIATNMAGRGVDIKLGGELPEEVLSSVNRVLRRADYDDPYDLSMEARRQALRALPAEALGIYEADVQKYLDYMDNMERVRELGGLHVIGSERHEARRIDNQLRGRSSRQGDPGSSRFYLSMDDELMRLFGGQQANDMMQRLRIDDALPIEVGLVSRIIEQSQTRVEGANFDVRKHLLEYDDVLNTQREKIYSQRNRIFRKDDLSEDVTDMLRTEVLQRVPLALEDQEGPWKLVAWLEQIQPTFNYEGLIFPSYSLRLLKELVGFDSPLPREQARQALLDIARHSLEAEAQHLLHAIDHLLVQSQERLELQLEERLETVDAFFQGLDLADETDTRTARELAEELSSLVRFPLRLTGPEQRALLEDPQSAQELVRDQVDAFLATQTVTRLLGAVERRLDEPLDLDAAELAQQDWDDLSERILLAIEQALERRQERYIGPGGEGLIAKDLDKALDRVSGPVGLNLFYGLLMAMPQGARAEFDRKTHRRVWKRTTRLTYIHYAAQAIENRDPEEVAEEVLAHLEDAQAAIRRAWGRSEYRRLANTRPADLDPKARRGLQAALGEADYREIREKPLGEIQDPALTRVVDELGRQAITEVYRQLLLGVISELWVEYLTRMEALRVSIGLEAYAQRDPLVQYKTRAFGMFQTLLGDMRNGVVTRMFTFQPRELSQVQAEVRRPEPPQVVEAQDSAPSGTSTKRGRRRRRKRR